MINIIGGKFKKKKIQVPNKDVRPTSAIKREAIFSFIESYGLKNNINVYDNNCCIDLFAGTGSLGLEAISRGCAFSYFFEINIETSKILKQNCQEICKENQYLIYQRDSLLLDVQKLKYPVSFIFIDPPYGLDLYEEIINKIINQNYLNKDSLIRIESDKNKLFNISNKLITINEKIYGKSKIIFLKKKLQ